MSARDAVHNHDRLAIRLSAIISRLSEGETLSLKALALEFGVSVRTLRRDFNQRLLHLDIQAENGHYRLSEKQRRDYSPGALSFIRSTGLASLFPSRSRQLMQLLLDDSGTSPCLIWHAGFPRQAQPECFVRLAGAIHYHRVVSLHSDGHLHDALEPCRLIYQSGGWYLVACQHRSVRVFRLEDITAVSLSERYFRRRSEIDALASNEDFIRALPHFHFISNVIHTFRE
ncbi:helix-turn-helix transcriptional regulator [Citrobacter sp. VF227]